MKSPKFFALRLLSPAFLVLIFIHSLYPQPPKVMDAAELQIALKKLTVLGSALYIAAHPDDENTALLSYLSKGRFVRGAYLSITRGEGGQNLIGSEQGDLLGIIRTQELLAARRIDGAEQFFTRAVDFGYTKSSDEALSIWNKDDVLADVVWIIRKFRPDIIITRFSPAIGGHGHHTASAILAEEAFKAAGDSSRYPEQLQFVHPWKPKRLMFNLARFFGVQLDTINSLKVDLGEYSPLLGRAFTEIAGISRSMHKSQGFGAPQGRGATINYFQHTAGDSGKRDLFDGINLTWSRIKNGERVGKILKEAYKAYVPENPSAIVPILLRAYSEMNKLPEDPWVNVKKKDLINVIRSCTGIWVDAITTDSSATPGSMVSLTATIINRSNVTCTLERLSCSYWAKDSTMHMPLQYNKPASFKIEIKLPNNVKLTQPYWLEEKSSNGMYRISEMNLVGVPENPPPLSVTFTLSIGKGQITLDAPFQYRWIDPVEGELNRPFDVVPPVAVNLTEKVFVFSNNAEKEISVILRSGKANSNGQVKMTLPAGWSIPPSIPFTAKDNNDEQTVTFSVKPSIESTDGTFIVDVETPDGKHSNGIHTIQYSHIPPQTLFPLAEGKLVRLDIKKAKQKIGYIMGSGDEIPTALHQLGYLVTLLSNEDLASRDLNEFETIIAGVRAYNTRPGLRMHQQRLLDYVNKGGAYIVQYVTRQRLESENLGPYPFNVSRDRVSVEDAPVTFLDPNHPLLNTPNKITQGDFQNWVQERGLYFADKWDSSYQTVLSSNDPNESPKSGGLLVARYGKGYYIYTGYSFFRQFPAGVAGAYRLFVNMIELGAKSTRINSR